jgi:hypothetical protein
MFNKRIVIVDISEKNVKFHGKLPEIRQEIYRGFMGGASCRISLTPAWML